MVYVKVTRGNCQEVLAFVEDFLFYCDPPFFTAAEKVRQLFGDSKEKEYAALCDRDRSGPIPNAGHQLQFLMVDLGNLFVQKVAKNRKYVPYNKL